MSEKAMLIDVSRCTGCRGCQVACKQWNSLAAEETTNKGTYENPPSLSGITWTKIKFEEDYGIWQFRKLQCLHCTDASCVSVCPTGAAAHHGEFVIFDQNVCVGCGFCVVSCPFSIPHKDESEGTARKCTLCIDRVSNQQIPACAKACPTGAIEFGDRRDMIEKGEKRVATLVANGKGRASFYGKNELGGLHVLYVLEDTPSSYNLPQSPQLVTSSLLAQWIGGLVTAGVVAALPLWLVFRRKKDAQEEQLVGANQE